MPIEVGQIIPDANLMVRNADKTHSIVPISEKLNGRKVVLVGLPGAFTGTCSGEHLPSLINAWPKLTTKGIDEIIVFAANDPQVMRAWADISGANDAGITLLADPMSEFTESLGLRFDAPVAGLIGRCIRFAAIVNDGRVEVLRFEEKPVGCSLTSGDAILDVLEQA